MYEKLYRLPAQNGTLMKFLALSFIYHIPQLIFIEIPPCSKHVIFVIRMY